MPRPKGLPKTGGKRKGYKAPQTLEKEQQRVRLAQQVYQAQDDMTTAQIANALGIRYLVTRDRKTGKFIRVGAAMAGRAQEETIEVWEKDPSIHAYADLMNRALDKPKEQPQELTVTGSLDIVAILRQRHARHARG